jgi:hypothetical protein
MVGDRDGGVAGAVLGPFCIYLRCNIFGVHTVLRECQNALNVSRAALGAPQMDDGGDNGMGF